MTSPPSSKAGGKRCTAHSSRTGKPCGNWPVKGAAVCRSHGGAAPQVRQAAAVRAAQIQAESQALRMVARAGVDVDPIEHLLESLYRAAALVEVWGAMVAALDAESQSATLRGELAYSLPKDSESRDELVVSTRERLLAFDSQGMAKVHPFISEYQSALERRARFAKLCIDAGVQRKQIELHERQVELAHRAFEAMLAELGLNPAQRQEARQTYARHLRVVA